MFWVQYVEATIVGVGRLCGMFILFLLIGFPAIVGVIIWLLLRNNTTSEDFCPHGYESFGCQPCCPLYEHCWGKREN